MSKKLTYPSVLGALLLHSNGDPSRSETIRTKGNVMSTLKVSVLALLIALPTGSWAKPHLREVSEIDDALYWIALASEISKKCDTLGARRVKGLAELWRLKGVANDMGYSDDEIRAYVESDAEKARMRKKGEGYLVALGANYDKPETFCAVGRAEIKKNSAIGVYLRAN